MKFEVGQHVIGTLEGVSRPGVVLGEAFLYGAPCYRIRTEIWNDDQGVLMLKHELKLDPAYYGERAEVAAGPSWGVP